MGDNIGNHPREHVTLYWGEGSACWRKGKGCWPPSLTWWMGWEGDDSYSSQCPYAQTKGQKGLAGQPYHWRKIHLISESEVVVCWGGGFVVVFLFFGFFFLLFPLHLFSKHLVFWTTEKKWMWKKLRNLYKTLYFLLDKEKCRSSAQICVYKSKREVLWSKAEGSLRHISCKYRDGLKFLQKKLFCHKGAHSFCFLNEQLFWKWVACVYHCGKAVVKCVDSCCWALIRFLFLGLVFTVLMFSSTGDLRQSAVM